MAAPPVHLSTGGHLTFAYFVTFDCCTSNPLLLSQTGFFSLIMATFFFFGRWAADAVLEIYNQQFLSISPVIIIF
jgi:hypothetical protein